MHFVLNGDVRPQPEWAVIGLSSGAVGACARAYLGDLGAVVVLIAYIVLYAAALKVLDIVRNDVGT